MAPMTKAERQKKYRQKLKENSEQYEEKKKHHREYMRSVRQPIGELSKDQQDKIRLQWKAANEKRRKTKLHDEYTINDDRGSPLHQVQRIFITDEQGIVVENMENSPCHSSPQSPIQQITFNPSPPLPIKIKTDPDLNTSTLRNQYFKKKLASAILERKTNMVKYKIELKKEQIVDLELKIKNLEYERMIKEIELKHIT